MRGNDLTVARFSPEHFDAIELQPAQAYVRELEAISGARISAVGVGPGREETVVLHDLL